MIFVTLKALKNSNFFVTDDKFAIFGFFWQN